MDEMKIKLSTKFMRGIVSKIISKAILTKFGFKTEIQINEIEIEKVNDKIHFHASVDADINEKALLKIARLANLDEGST